MAKRLIAPALVITLLVVAAVMMFGSEERRTVTALFPRTVSLYEGSEVKVLGIPVGTVDTVEPQGTSVKVTMSYDADVDVPADAQAVIIAPSIVGDRFVQLTPVYSGEGPKLQDGAKLDMTKTGTPLELDEVYQSIDDLTVALGPEGANSDGALSDLLATTAENFGGQGEQFNRTIKDLGRLTGTLENNKEELFGTAQELEKFVGTLADNDKIVRDFNASMASVSELLEGEREELAASLSNLATALTQVNTFVKDNRQLLGKNIKGLNRLTKILVNRRADLQEIVRVAPLALNNLALTYNPQAGTLDTRANLGNVLNQLESDPALVLCSLVGVNDKSGALCDLIEQALPRAATFGNTVSAGDPTFGGLLEVER